MRRILTLISLLLAATFITACGENDEQTTTVGSGDTSDTAKDDLPLGAGPYPIADLSISFTDAAGNLAEYRLACLGDTASFTGDVPPGVDAATACLSVASDTARMLLDPDVMFDRMCTEIYGGPETATVGGLLDDIEVDFEINRTNGCGIDDWERVFAGLVPPHAAQSEPA
jgi:predicted small secreted protein